MEALKAQISAQKRKVAADAESGSKYMRRGSREKLEFERGFSHNKVCVGLPRVMEKSAN